MAHPSSPEPTTSTIIIHPGPRPWSGDLDDPEYVAELNSRHADCPCGEDCDPDNCIYDRD